MPVTEFKLEYTEIIDSTADTAAVIVAAGNSLRMGGRSKQLMSLNGLPVIARTLLAFENCGRINSIVLVARDGDIPELQRICDEYRISKLTDITAGGDTRSRSVQKGIALCRDAEFVAIHDGARPLIKDEVIIRTISDAEKYGGAAAAVPVKDTVKIGDEAHNIVSTPDRSRLFAVQTPQVFRLSDYRAAADSLKAELDFFTDDCAVMERAGYTVHLSAGDYRNIKITTPEDMIIAEAFLKSEEI